MNKITNTKIKKIFSTFIAFILIICATLFITACGKKEDSPSAAPPLSIKDIQNDPLSYTGEVTLNGIVAGLGQEDQTLFGIVDTEELLLCKNLNCGAYMQYSVYSGDGSLPELADEVNITGKFYEHELEDGSKYPFFEVTKIDVKRNVMDLLTN